MSEYLDKLKSIGVMRRKGQSRERREKTPAAVVKTTEYWDGRQDATVTPDTVRFGARVHNTGSKKGQAAEIHKMSDKQRKQHYGG